MNFTKPERSQTHEEWVAAESQRMAWRREKFAQRRKKRNDGFYDDQTVLIEPPPKPTVCKVHDCDRKHKALGLCDTHYKQRRRSLGNIN